MKWQNTEKQRSIISGETGTGKELIARTVHNLSPRANRPFLEINCATLPENLLESELFGHEKGAFTDAKARKIGLFETANKGTIFLDEMGDINIGLQAKLLRVLEDRRVRRLGGTQVYEVDVRIIAATNQNLREAIKEKRFREDLYYRLHIVPIHVPPFRERREDILALAKYFLAEYARKFSRSFGGISSGAKTLLLNYSWPGNARELRHVIERICIMHDANMLEATHLPKELTGDPDHNVSGAFLPDFPIPSEGIDLESLVDQFAFHLIKKAIAMADGNISQAAKLLGMPRGTLRYKLEKSASLSAAAEVDSDRNGSSTRAGFLV